MGTIKKLYQDQLVGGSGSAGQEVYPVTSTLGVYDDENNQLQGVLDKVTTNLGLFTCGTAAATAAKTVSASKFVLMEGGSVKIKFTYANSADSPTLAIGSTAAKPIMFNGSAASASNSWGAGEIVEFFYDGTNWVGNSTSVSVSQNTSTRHTDISVGDVTTPVASVDDVLPLPTIVNDLYGSNLFTDATKETGKGYRSGQDRYMDDADYGVFQIEVNGGDIIYISGITQPFISYYGWKVQNAATQRLDYGEISGDFVYIVPQNGVLFECTYKLSDTMNVRKYSSLGDEVRPEIAKNTSDISNINNILLSQFFSDNMFSSLTKEEGTYWNVIASGWSPSALMAEFDLTVYGGQVVFVSGYNNEYKYNVNIGFRANSSVGSGLVESKLIKGDFYYFVPNNVKQIQVSYSLADASNMSVVVIDDINEQINTINSSIHNADVNVPIKIKDFGDFVRIDGYRYLSFFSGICVNGKEYHIGRDGGGHRASSSYPDSKLVIFGIDANGNRTLVNLSLPYSSINGEPFDPNLSITRDGAYLLLSTFCADQNDLVVGSYLFILDTSFNVVSTIDLWAQGLRNVWGNTLQTPDNYLLKLSYTTIDGIDYLSLWKSNEKITDTTTLTFSKVYDFPTEGNGLNEGTIGYVKDKLVLVSRVHNHNSVLASTSVLDGASGWSAYTNLGYVIHCPAMKLYNKDSVFPFAGGLFINSSTRQPCIGYFDIDGGGFKSLTIIDTNITGAGGYPSFVEIEDNVFALMYYDDYQNSRTAVYYQRVNARYKCKTQYIL